MYRLALAFIAGLTLGALLMSTALEPRASARICPARTEPAPLEFGPAYHAPELPRGEYRL